MNNQSTLKNKILEQIKDKQNMYNLVKSREDKIAYQMSIQCLGDVLSLIEKYETKDMTTTTLNCISENINCDIVSLNENQKSLVEDFVSELLEEYWKNYDDKIGNLIEDLKDK